jgi:hypothetical protein
MLMTLPWWFTFIIQKSVVLFIVSYAFVGADFAVLYPFMAWLIFLIAFFIAAVHAPVMHDLAMVSHGMEGVGFAHVYGAFNLAYGVGNASE